MGLFGTNWEKELERAERLLADDVPAGALDIALRAERKGGAEVAARALGMVTRARQALLASVLARANAAEEAGDWDDAVDWLDAALEHEPSEIRREELRERQSALRNRESPSSPAAVRLAAAAGQAMAPQSMAGPVEAVDVEQSYETLVTMLSPEIRELYESQPGPFRQAVVDLHSGAIEAARTRLEEIATASPDDGVVHLELGHARLSQGDAGAARDAFDVAWSSLGAEALDDAETMRIPAFWAEACLAAGDAEVVIERLEPMADIDSGPLELCRLWAEALVAGGQRTRARSYLETLVPLASDDPDLTLLFAQTLVADGEVERAREGLERVVQASCTPGCATPSLHLPSFRFLARLHLREGGEPARAQELLARVADLQGGLEAEDLELVAQCQEAVGSPAAAGQALAEAGGLADFVDDATAAPDFECDP